LAFDLLMPIQPVEESGFVCFIRGKGLLGARGLPLITASQALGTAI
jgi:hypothetical protein